MAYLIDSVNPRAGMHGYAGTGGLGSVERMEDLAIAKRLAAGTVTKAQVDALRAAQLAWDSKAKIARDALKMVPGMVASKIEAEVLKKLGPRPSVSNIPVTSAAKPAATTAPTFRLPTFRATLPRLPGPATTPAEIVAQANGDVAPPGGGIAGPVMIGAVVIGALVLLARR